MKFELSTIIDAPRDQVVACYIDQGSKTKWQEGLVSYEPLEGSLPQVGSKATVRFESNQGTQELTETIISNNLPHDLTGLYEHKHMDNTMANRFEALSVDQTRYSVQVEYTAFRGFMPRMMALFFPSVFRKQVEKYMENFKQFVEGKNY